MGSGVKAVRLECPSQGLDFALCKMEAFQRPTILSPNSFQGRVGVGGGTSWCFRKLYMGRSSEF